MVQFGPPLNFPNYVSNVGGSVVCKSFPCECLNMQNFVHEIETLHESMQGPKECVRILDLRVQVHPGELWISKQRVHIVLEASKPAGAKGKVPKI